MPKQPPRSALVDQVMPDASEEEKAEATRNWFAYLDVLAGIAKRLAEERDQAKD